MKSMFDRHGNILDEKLRAALSREPQIQEMEKVRQALDGDPSFPRYHFCSLTPGRKMNDPNGLCIKDGVMHLFYQQWPYEGSPLHWGHAISRDMIRWTELPTAIAPGEEKHVFSGTTLVESNRVLAAYHGVGKGNMLAQATDEYLLSWEKLPQDTMNPAVPIDENGLPYRVFDPCLWQEEDGYYALSGTFIGPPKKLRGKHRMMPYIFYSPDLKNWKWLGEFMPHNPFYSQGEDCACPYFLPFGDRYMLMHFSHTSGSHILIGDYDKKKHIFLPTEHYPLSAGEVLGCSGGIAAGAAASDGKGGVYAIFNLKTCINRKGDADGVMTLPWHMQQDANGQFCIRPCENAGTLRGQARTIECDRFVSGSPYTVNQAGNCIEIEAEIDLSRARALRINVLASSDGREHTDITVTRRPEDSSNPNASYPYLYDQTARVFLTVDSTLASMREDLWPRAAETMDTVLSLNEPIRLRIFLDVNVIEVFLNDRLAIAQSVQPVLPDSRNVTFLSVGGDAPVQKLNIWEMQPV